MKTFTKQTEEQYLETVTINDKNELVLKQEYANQIVEELRAKDLVCDCIRLNIVRREDMIYFLRKDREVPYVTIEVKDKKVTQVEGDMNNRFISKSSPEYEAIKEWARINKFTLL